MIKKFKDLYVLKAYACYTTRMLLAQLAYAIGQYYVWVWLLKNYSWARYLVFHEKWVFAWTVILVVDAFVSYYIREGLTNP